MYDIQFYTGLAEPKIVYKLENGKLVAYGYSIHRDANGVETSRTEPFKISTLTMVSSPKKGILSRLFDFLLPED